MSDRLSYENLVRRVAELEGALERFSSQEQESRRKLDYLEKLACIDTALRSSSDIEIVLWEVMGQILAIFQCNRAWLLSPCDPDAPTWRIPVERTTPEYPGAKERAIDVPMTPEMSEIFRRALRAPGPCAYGPGALPLTENMKSWRVQSQLSMALRLNAGSPWQFGIHQCSYPRTWSPAERELFREAGYRLAMTLNLLLTNRLLHDSQTDTPRDKGRFERNVAGGIISYDADHRNVSEDNAAMHMLCVQHDPARTLAVTANVREGLGICLDDALAASGMDAGGIYFFDHDGSAAEPVCHRSLTPDFLSRVSRALLDMPTGRSFRQGEALFFKLDDLPPPLKAAAEAEGLRSLAIVPILHEERAVGSLNVASRKTEEVPGTAREALAALGHLIGSATARFWAEQALRKSEERYRRLVGEAPLGVVEVSPDGRMLYSNPAHDRLFGYDEGELTGKSVLDLLTTDVDRRQLAAYVQSLAAATSSVTPWAGTCRRRDGTPVDITVNWSHRRDDAGRVLGFSAIVTEVTERRRAQDALQESEEKFRSFAEESPSMIFILRGKRIIYANRQCEKLLDYTREELYGEGFEFQTLLESGDHEYPAGLSGGDTLGEEVLSQACRLLRRGGGCVDVIVACRNFAYRGTPSVMAIVTDISNRREAEEALKASEERYRGLVEKSHDVIFTLDCEGRFTLLNPAFEMMTGWRVEEWLGRHFKDIIHPDCHEILEERFASMRAGGQLPQNEVLLLTKGGDLLTIEYNSIPILEGGVMVGVWGIARDVTAQRKAEEDRRGIAALREREDVSRWLHDHLGADLYNILLIADSIQRKGNVGAAVDQHLEWITETSREALAGIRNYLDFASSFGAAFEDVVTNMEEYGSAVLTPLGVNFHFERRGTLGACTLTAIQSFNMYLIFKEALTNIVKHAWASRVEVLVALENGVLSLSIEDDGRGLTKGERTCGQGRMNIRARAEELGSDLAIFTKPGGGTKVMLALPLPVS